MDMILFTRARRSLWGRVVNRDRDVEAIESDRDETVVADEVDQLIDAELPEHVDRPPIGRFSKDPTIQQICRGVVSHLRLFGEVRWSLPRGDRRDLIFGDTGASSDSGVRVNFESGSKASANHENDDLP